MATIRRSSVRTDVIAAYRALAAGDAEPLIAACAETVEWVETIGPRVVDAIAGHSAVATRLDDCMIASRRIVLRGITVDDASATFEFAEPWWDASRGWLRRATAVAIGVKFTQHVSFGSAIERIVSAQLAAAGPEEQSRLDFLSMFLGR